MATAAQEEFTIDGCRVCINVRDWADRVQRATIAKKAAAALLASSTLSSDTLLTGISKCPPDAAELGKATWTFLHTMSVYYPQTPTPDQQADMHSLLVGLSKFYPCEHCATHMRKQLTVDPPQVTSRAALASWLCRLHNEVNMRLGKPMFDCEKVFERWKTGPSDGSCDSLDL